MTKYIKIPKRSFSKHLFLNGYNSINHFASIHKTLNYRTLKKIDSGADFNFKHLKKISLVFNLSETQLFSDLNWNNKIEDKVTLPNKDWKILTNELDQIVQECFKVFSKKEKVKIDAQENIIKKCLDLKTKIEHYSKNIIEKPAI